MFKMGGFLNTPFALFEYAAFFPPVGFDPILLALQGPVHYLLPLLTPPPPTLFHSLYLSLQRTLHCAVMGGSPGLSPGTL